MQLNENSIASGIVSLMIGLAISEGGAEPPFHVGMHSAKLWDRGSAVMLVTVKAVFGSVASCMNG